MTMRRRDSLKAIGVLLAGAGVSVSPVATHEAEAVEMVIMRLPPGLTQNDIDRLRAQWKEACEGTALDGVRTVMLPYGMDAEFVRR